MDTETLRRERDALYLAAVAAIANIESVLPIIELARINPPIERALESLRQSTAMVSDPPKTQSPS
jgi:hypothetical protein